MQSVVSKLPKFPDDVEFLILYRGLLQSVQGSSHFALPNSCKQTVCKRMH